MELTKEQKDVLFSEVDESLVEIRPDGIIYLPWHEYSKRLRDAFGISYKIEIQKHELLDEWLHVHGALVIDGEAIATAIGEETYKQPTERTPYDKKMSYGETYESAVSNLIMRLCKRIGVGLELWDKRFIERWKSKHAEKYWDTKKNKYLWRMKGEADTESEIKTPEPKSNKGAKGGAKWKENFDLLVEHCKNATDGSQDEMLLYWKSLSDIKITDLTVDEQERILSKIKEKDAKRS